MTHLNRIALVGLAIVGASVAFKPSTARAGICFGCGNNAATVGDGIVFDELNVRGERRRGGPRIREARLVTTGEKVKLVVEGDNLVAFAGAKKIEQRALADVAITLDMADGREYELTIDSFDDQLHYWAAPDGLVPAYVIMVKKKSPPKHRPGTLARAGTIGKQQGDGGTGEPKLEHLCTGKYVEQTVNQREGQQFLAIAFTGEHYSRTHEVTTTPSDGWFNLACFGTAAFKMHLLRHTTVSAATGKAPTVDQRTAMLRAITADYCGDGRAWTGDGTPLWWTDQRQLFPLAQQPDFSSKMFPDHIEAVWGRKGELLCLNEPRRTPGAGPPTKNCSVPAVPRSVVAAGRVACPRGGRIPRCSDFSWAALGRTPWDGAPLLPNLQTPSASLSTAYVITVNRPGAGDYCNPDPPGVISWR
jgi:hypothetical protein